ncbi:MAG: DegV family protein [Solobacterium sp.]|nr:DegV family protein [Solobacterium sp.]
MSYLIVTDAASDLGAETVSKYSLAVIPMTVEIDGNNYLYGGDESTITCTEFYDLERKGYYANTSRIAPDVFKRYFAKYLEQGMDILYLCFSSGLSGTFESACLAVEQLKAEYPERMIYCIDTLCASVGQAFLVLEALDRQAEGYSMKELANWVGGHIFHTDHWFTLDTLSHLVKGGRITPAAASLGRIVQLKPMLRLNAQGKLTIQSKPRGHKKSLRLLLKQMEDHWLPLEGKRVIIGHGGMPEYAEELQMMVKEKFPESQIQIMEIGPVIGSHTGPGMLALIFWGDIR